MKKFLALAVIAIASIGAFGASAQDSNIYAGGSIGYWHDSHDSNTGTSTNQLTILPEVGYNFNPKWAVGVQLGYDYTHLCGQSISTNLFQFNPYLRYTYFRSSNNMVSLFIDGAVGVGAGWTHYGDDDDSKTAVTWNIGFRPGISVNLTENFSLVAHVGMIGYRGANNAAQEAGYSNKGGVMLNGNDLTFGFYYNF